MGNAHPGSGNRGRSSNRLSDYDADADAEEQWLQKAPLLGRASNKPSRLPPSVKPGPLKLTRNGAGPIDPSDDNRPPWPPAYEPLPANQIISQLKLRVSILEFLLKKQTDEMKEMKLKNSGFDNKVLELATKIDDMVLSAKNNDDKDLPSPPPPASSATVDVPNLIDMEDDDRCKSPRDANTTSGPDCDHVIDWQLLMSSIIRDPILVRINGIPGCDILLMVFIVFMVVGLLL